MGNGFLILLLSVTAAVAAAPNACDEHFAQLANRLKAEVDLDQPEIHELKTREVDGKLLDAVKKGDTSFHYVVDADGRVLAVQGPLPYSGEHLEIALIADSSGKKVPVPIHESGSITWDTQTKKFVFRPEYSLDLSEDERAAVAQQVEKRVPGVAVRRAAAPAEKDANSFTQVLTCADVLAGQLNGKNFQLDRLITRNVVAVSTMGLKEADIRRKYKDDPASLAAAERKLWLVYGVDTIRRTGTTYAGGVVGKALTEREAGQVVQYGARLGTGFASNYVVKEMTDQLNPMIKKLQGAGEAKDKKAELTPDIAWKIMMYNNANMVLTPPLGTYFDKQVLKDGPVNYYEACRQGKKLRFLISPRMLRVYESGIWTIIGLPKYFLWGV